MLDGPVNAAPQQVNHVSRIDPQSFTLSVLVPVYNEQATIREILRRVAAVPIRKEIIVIDDGSTDDTARLLREVEAQGLATEPGNLNTLRVLYQSPNQGKGAALRAGFQVVSGEIVVIQDADLEYDPDEYPNLIGPILDGRADAVYGSRFMGGAPHRVLFFWHMVGNKLLTLISNMFTNLNLTDMETGAKAFRADVITQIPLHSDRFGFEPEVTAKLARMQARIYEIGCSYSGRQYWQGKKIGLKDGFAALHTIVANAFSRDDASQHPVYAARHQLERSYRYNRWLWERVAPLVGERVLQVSRGVANLAPHLLTRPYVVVSDSNPWTLRAILSTWGDGSQIEARQCDLATDAWSSPGEFDTVLCLDALQTVQDDDRGLRLLHEALTPGGCLVLLVPALPALYGDPDATMGTLRRYDPDDLRAQLRAAGFRIDDVEYVNRPGAVAWYVGTRVFPRAWQTRLPDLQAWLSERSTAVLRRDLRQRPEWGASLLAVARRSE